MLKKVISIKNVGNFVDFQHHGQIDFSKMALIYGENGKGKTTLSAILRSLGTNKTEYILGRRSLGVPDTESIVVSILTDDGTVKFNSAKSMEWDKSVKNIEIFDSIFVNENVFSGDYVDLEHQRKLYLFVVGEESVERAKRIDELTQKINDLNPQIRVQESDVRNLIKGGIDLEVFVGLPDDTNAQEQLDRKEKELRDYSESAEIKIRLSFNLISLPQVEVEIIKTKLSQTLETVSATAEKRTLEHLQKYSIPDGENWIRQGVEHICDETCPFCGQSLESIDVINAFRDYFNQTYISFKKDIGEVKANYDSVLSETMLRNIQKDIFSNNTSLEFWKDFLQFGKTPEIDTDFLQLTWDSIKNELASYFDKKLQAPLESVELGDLQSLKQYKKLLANVSEYNAVLSEANKQIAELKKKIAQTDEQVLKAEIVKLQNQITRHSATGKSECDKYQALLKDKEKLEKEKKGERKVLETETNLTFSKYQSQINYHLEQIGVNFRIHETKPNFKGGKASSSFSIEINGNYIELGGQDIDKPGFKNTLSDGDKNTLAFALFLAKLNHDTKLNEKIVVFDDPVNSLDRYRKNYTIEQIETISKIAKQVIVLSHDPYFLRELWRKFERKNTATLCIKRAGNSSHIEAWNIEKETDTDYILNYRQLHEYMENGDIETEQMRSVARSIRPALEGYFRMKYPLDFGEKEWLKDFIKKVRSSATGNRLFTMKDLIDETEKLCEYSSNYHHKQNLNTEPIDDVTLRSYINRAFKIIHQ
jgi:wobble nucleotide-excising tRNase